MPSYPAVEFGEFLRSEQSPERLDPFGPNRICLGAEARQFGSDSQAVRRRRGGLKQSLRALHGGTLGENGFRGHGAQELELGSLKAGQALVSCPERRGVSALGREFGGLALRRRQLSEKEAVHEDFRCRFRTEGEGGAPLYRCGGLGPSTALRSKLPPSKSTV